MPELTVDPRAYIRPSPARGHLGRFYCIPQSLYQTQSCPRSTRQVLLQTLELTLDLVLLAVIQVGSTVYPRAYIKSFPRSSRQVLLYTLQLTLDLVLLGVIQVGSTVDPRAYIRPSPACGHLGRFSCRPQSLYQTQSWSRSFRQVLLQTLEFILDLVLLAAIQVGSAVDPTVSSENKYL